MNIFASEQITVQTFTFDDAAKILIKKKRVLTMKVQNVAAFTWLDQLCIDSLTCKY